MTKLCRAIFWKMQRHSQFVKLDLNTRSTDGCVFAKMRDLVSETDQERIQDRALLSVVGNRDV